MTPRGQGRSQSLSQGRFGHRSGRVRGLSRRLRPLALVATLGVLAFTLSGCSWVEAVALGWPEGITPQAHVNRQLWIGSVIAAAVIGVIVYGLIFWTSAFHRKKKDDTEFPRQFGYNMPLELVLTVVPFLIVAVLFYFTVVVQEKLQHLEKDPEVVIDITAFQWNWKFGYQRVAFKDGRFNYEGADDAKKKAMTSKPEGKDRHGEELVGPIHGAEHRGPQLSELRQGRNSGHQHRNSGSGAAGPQAHRVHSSLRRRSPHVVGAGVPVQT